MQITSISHLRYKFNLPCWYIFLFLLVCKSLQFANHFKLQRPSISQLRNSINNVDSTCRYIFHFLPRFDADYLKSFKKSRNPNWICCLICLLLLLHFHFSTLKKNIYFVKMKTQIHQFPFSVAQKIKSVCYLWKCWHHFQFWQTFPAIIGTQQFREKPGTTFVILAMFHFFRFSLSFSFSAKDRSGVRG